MPDLLDRVSEHSAKALEANIQTVRNRTKEVEASPTGRCLYCEAPLQEARFCDKDCSDDYQKYIRRS